MAKKTEVFEAEFEIIETKMVKASPEQKGVEIFAPENKEKIIQAFVNSASLNYSFTPAQSKKMVKESSKLSIKDKDDKEGFKKVYEQHRKFVKARTSTDKERKVLVEPFMEIKKRIDDVAKDDILGILVNEEARLKSEVDQWRAWEEEETARIEKEEADRINQRVSELEEVGIKFDGAFYSCGENISVDIVTIKDLSEEAFSELKKRVSVENEKIEKAEAVQKLHDERRESLLEFWSFVPEDLRTQNFGEMTEKNFSEILENAKIASEKFDDDKKKQEEEAKKQIDDRKALNYEKRSFQLEKEGFEIYEDGSLFFANEQGRTSISKERLENSTKEEFELAFETIVKAKSDIEQRLKDSLKEKEEADAKKAEENKKALRTKTLLNVGFEKVENGFESFDHFVGENVVFDSEDEEFANDVKNWTLKISESKAKKEKETADKAEAERLQNLPEIQKAERYVEEVMKVEIPQLNGAEIAEIISEFKNQIKKASDEAISKLKKLA
mgnify:CR=1 FL=1